MLRPYAAFCLRLGESPRYTARLLDNVMCVHHRLSIRLKGYDYAQAGAYFVTICTQNRQCLFGDIVDGEMRLNANGREVQALWNELPNRFARLELDAFAVMPNHVHGIIVIPGRGESCIRPDDCQQPNSGDHKDRPYGTGHAHGIVTLIGPGSVVGAGPRACPDHGGTETVPCVGAGLALPEEKGAARRLSQKSGN